MYVRHNARRIGCLVMGVVTVLGALSGCATATPERAIPQEVATSTPTAIPTSTPTTEPTAVPTMTSTAAPTALPTATFTPVPTAVPTATATLLPAEPTCAPVPVTAPPDPASPDGDPGLYTVIGLANDELLTMHPCPGSDNPLVRALEPYSVGLQRAGQDAEAEGLLWTPVSYGDITGWVKSGHLARQYGDGDPEVAARAGRIVRALRDQDWGAVSSAVHPDKGVRFSPYTFVRIGEGEDADRVFSAGEVAGLAADATLYHWGWFDGSGEPIEMTLLDYYARFVYDADFAWAYAVGYNETIGAGNTINNVAEIYPEAQVVEFHLPGSDPRFGGMDWRSLRLVLEKVGDAWYLVGVVHDEWTI